MENKKLFKDVVVDDEIFYIIKNNFTGNPDNDIKTARYIHDGLIWKPNEMYLNVEIDSGLYKDNYAFAVDDTKSFDTDYFEDELCYIFTTREEAEERYKSLLNEYIDEIKSNAYYQIQCATELEETYLKRKQDGK